MLVLTRKQGEKISIDDNTLQISIISVTGSRVQIGIRADASVRIVRAELLEAMTDASTRCQLLEDGRQLLEDGIRGRNQL